MRTILLALAAAACVIATASAQTTPSPVMQHYRAYQAALEANDLAAAETSAVAALAAAEAANDRRTAALAMNLATLRLNRGNAAGAREPATHAMMLADNGAANVNPAFARLILGRAELGSGDANGATRLLEVLPAAQENGIASDEIYDAAVQLGDWTFRQERYTDSQLAWTIAQNNAHTSRLPPAYAAGRARVWRGAAMALGAIPTRGRNRNIDEAQGQAAYVLLGEAVTMLAPLAIAEARDGDVTIGQQAYGEAVAWRAAVSAKLRSDGFELPPIEAAAVTASADQLTEVGATPTQLTRPRCSLAIRPEDGMRMFPTSAIVAGQIAGVAIRFRIDAQGQLIEKRAIAVIGDESFGPSAERGRWIVERREDSAPNCRMEMTVIRSISFVLGG